MSKTKKETKRIELTERGVHLEQAAVRQHCSGINHGMQFEADGLKLTIGSRCPKCRMRVRGLNHHKGHHHIVRVLQQS